MQTHSLSHNPSGKKKQKSEKPRARCPAVERARQSPVRSIRKIGWRGGGVQPLQPHQRSPAYQGGQAVGQGGQRDSANRGQV